MNDSRKTYLVIGGSSGIGLSIAKRLATNGARIIIVSQSKSKLEKAASELDGEHHLTFSYDLSDSNHIEDVFSYIHTNNILLDGMVYSAGIAPLCLLKENTPMLMEKVFQINFFSFVESVKYFQMETVSCNNARIVAIASIMARGSGYRQTLYGAAKAALVSSVKLMAKELLNRGIHINCISPGVVESELLDDLRINSAGLDEKIKNTQLLGIITPESIADAAHYLLTAGSEFLTGGEFIIDGGALLK